MLKFKVDTTKNKTVQFNVNNHIVNTGEPYLVDIYLADEKFMETDRGLELDKASVFQALGLNEGGLNSSATYHFDGGELTINE